MMKDKALKVSQVAAILNVHKTTVYQMIYAGNIKAYKVGMNKGEMRIDESELKKYKKKQLVKKGSGRFLKP